MNANQPALEPPVTFTVSFVARLLGVAPDTLRTWDRRYQIGPTVRTSGSYRRYSQDDVRRLETLVRLIKKGVAVSEAARIAKSGAGEETVIRLSLVRTEVIHQDANTLPVDAHKGLHRAVESLDSRTCQRIVTNALDHFGVIATWNELLRPVLTQLGSAWQNGTSGVEHEHLLSEAVSQALTLHIEKVLQPRSHRPVLLAGAPNELHVLPLLATSAAAAEQQVECRMLGPMVPYESLAAAIERTGPAAVMIWSHSAATGEPTPLVSLPKLRAPYQVLVGGQGWAEVLPSNVQRVTCIADAVSELVAATR